MQNNNGTERHFGWSQFVDKVFWFVITACALGSASFMRGLSQNIAELNTNMAIVVYQMSENQEWKKATSSRLELLERRCR